MGVAKEELCGDVRLWVREAWELRKEVDSFARSKRITYTAAQSLEGIACKAQLGHRLGYGQMESAQVTIPWSRTRAATPGLKAASSIRVAVDDEGPCAPSTMELSHPPRRFHRQVGETPRGERRNNEWRDIQGGGDAGPT